MHELRLGAWQLTVSSDYEAAVAALEIEQASSLEALCDGAQSRAFGRGTNAILSLPGERVRLHLRPFRHGGLLARWTGRRLLTMARPNAELRATAALRKNGAPVPIPILALGRRVGRFFEAAVGCVHEEDCLDGASFLASKPNAARLERGLTAAGRAVRALHDAGGEHADLQIRNLLIREDANQAEVRIVDLDGARVVASVSPARRMREIMRLRRSLLKRRLENGSTPEASQTFLAAYLDGDSTLGRQMLRHRRRESLRVAAHALFYH